MKEYDRTEAAFYDYYATGIEGDVQFYVEEAQKSGSPVLEIGCGTGRILIPVAESGINIVGLDRAPAMLSIAKQKIAKLNVDTQGRIKLVEGDMRNFSLDQRFKLVMIPYQAFLHLLTSEDQRQALCCIREHLADNGLLVFNIFDPRLDIIVAHFGSLGSAMKKDSEFVHPDTSHKVIVWDSRQYDPGRQMLEQYFIFEELDDEGRVISKTYSPITLRYVYRYEMQYLLELCGYEIEALYGDFQRGHFRHGGEQIWVARRS
ncbi:class I SAM-dependent methyltransferase [Candidatus Poribacteria bacterium]|nr:class I SAM-dependent methyltransferase [Candidatus Poribacteria bacterium]